MSEFTFLRELRSPIDSLAELWPEHRRERYLLRNVAIPLSADYRVWPHARDDSVSPQAVVVTAIDDTARALQIRMGLALEPAVFAGNLNCKKLGYDVCDVTLLSGLLNCGYNPDDKENLAGFALGLNEWHLFRESQLAEEFAVKSNARIAEHSPFGVFGVYALADID